MTAVILLGVLLLAGRAEGAPGQVRGAVHVHTTFSTGVLSLEEVAEEARQQGIGALILADNFLLRFEYGLAPFRSLVRKTVEKPSVRRLGSERWLRAVEAAQARFPDLVLIPGVEVIPYYRWTGSPLPGKLTMWDAQKNLLVVGLSEPDEYAGIPAIGNGGILPDPVHVAAALFVIGGGMVLLNTRRLRARWRRLPGWVALGGGLLLTLDALLASELHPYRGDLGLAPHQRVIDYAESRGGIALWSFPEARDFGRLEVGGFGTVLVRTEPYPEALAQTEGYTGFGALYPDHVTLAEPGRQWDQLLLEYARGRRPRPAWGFGELGYHGPPKRLGEVQTVFLTPERSQEAILGALRAGRFYAVKPPPDYSLVLDEFSVGQAGRPGWTPMGGERRVEGRAILIRLRVSASDGREAPFTLRLIRSGRLLSVLEERTPFETVLETSPPEGQTREFFRVEITTPHRLLSNPIFVRRQG